MPDHDNTDPTDEVSDINAGEIAANIARFCPDCSQEEILRHVQDVIEMMRPSSEPA